MTDIVKKTSSKPVEWNPLRAMREMLHWDPFREMAPVFAMPAFEELAWNPSFEVTEHKDAFLFKADVPGVKAEDLEITTLGNRIQISGKRQSEHETKAATVYTYERQYGSFSRSFTLPDGADIAHARTELANGVLTLVIPKVAAALAKKIPIATGPKS